MEKITIEADSNFLKAINDVVNRNFIDGITIAEEDEPDKKLGMFDLSMDDFGVIVLSVSTLKSLIRLFETIYKENTSRVLGKSIVIKHENDAISLNSISEKELKNFISWLQLSDKRGQNGQSNPDST